MYAPAVLMWVIPIVLIIPNIILDITDYGSWLEKAVNILLPGGIYLWLASLSRNVGRTALLMFPLILYSAFQMVLLYLYGESIIAVDMFINLVTTNVSEATELLGNLSMAIFTVIILYLAPLIWATVLVCTRRCTTPAVTRTGRRLGAIITGISVVFLAAAYIFVPRFAVTRDIFPVNVFNNTITAARRIAATTGYFKTSAGFDHHAATTRPDSLREVYVLVIGETSRADNWQLGGYSHPTNPKLSRRTSLVFFDKALSQSNTTHKSVPLLLSPVKADNFADSIYSTRSLISAFGQAGYATAFLSNQAHNRSFIDFFSREADRTLFLTDDGRHHYDGDLLGPLREFTDTCSSPKMLIVLHTYGSHFNYIDRYPDEYERFMPAESGSASMANRDRLINSYDNTILYTDAVVDSVISIVDSLACPAAVMYLSDHGEDIFDDARERFLHASPVPTYHQIHVPLLLWTSAAYNAMNPTAIRRSAAHTGLDVASNDIVFDTMLSLAGITADRTDSTRSLVDSSYTVRPRLYLNDYNEAVSLKAAGLRDYDFDLLHKNHISEN